jgi:PKHD-type hydroxylase
MKFNQYWLWDRVLPKWFCEQQIENTDWSKQTAATVYSTTDINALETDPNIRVVDIVWEKEISPIGCILQIYANMANLNAGWNFDLLNCDGIQIAKYTSEKKSFHDWHQDHGYTPNDKGFIRKLSASILLSDENTYEGGDFEFKNFDKQPMLKQGSILVFPSQLEHRVSPMISGKRYSAVTWINGPAYR